jgi:sugar phosphate isomerase/epimerase
VSIPQAWDHLLEGVSECLVHAKGTILAIEPEPGFFVETTTDAIALIQTLLSVDIRLNLDIGHVYLCEQDYLGAIEKAMLYTRHIHIEDIKSRIHRHEIPGEGDIDFEAVFRILKQHQYRHYISVELYHHNTRWAQALEKSRQYLIPLLRNGAPTE